MMTIEQKAKAYDEVINKVKDYYDGNTKMYSDINQTLEYLFPEFKENENKDEIIRKALITYFISVDEAYAEWEGIEISNIIAWLEKQKMKIWNKDDEHMLNICCILLNEQRKHQISQYDIDDCISWICTLKQRMGKKYDRI